MFPDLFLVVILFYVGVFYLRKRRRGRLPPGPRGYPLVGNIRELSRSDAGKHSWDVYSELSATYGDIVYLQVLGQPVILLNSAEAAWELLEKRSSNYSQRAVSIMVNELMGWEWDMALMPYSDRWKLHRKIFRPYFEQRAIPSYHPILLSSVATLLQGLLKSPGKWASLTEHYVANNTMKIIYNYNVQSENDSYVQLVEDAMASLNQALQPGSFFVDFLPFLKYVPSWIPGAGFQRHAREGRRLSLAIRDVPYDLELAKINQGKASTSFVAQCLSDPRLSSESPANRDEVIRNCAGVGYVAGTDTTSSLLHVFVLAMVLNPSVVKKAQEEIDTVVGNGRLPSFEDRSNLPYVDAILSEAMRWMPVGPIGIPHKSTNDDVYNGYLIPSGSIIITNAWGMLHDPQTYPQPSEFRPERFLSNDDSPAATDPMRFAFGFGRRICPGRYLAASSVWLAISNILAVYNIDPVKDEHGNNILPPVECNEGIACRPLPFNCCFTPRSEKALHLITECEKPSHD